ncbi:MAG: carboxypeptidase-like regulatory domain-containing protein [Planctomycetota bacterium]
MPSTRPGALAALAASLCLAAAAAQAGGAARGLRPLLGKVVDAAGAPLIGAEVHVVLPDVTAPGNRAASHAVVRTDARGRFRALVVPCTHHLIWAVAAPAPARVCSTVRWVSSGQLLELHADQERPVCRVSVGGLDAWRDLAPFRVRLAVQGVELPWTETALGDGDSCTIPAPPRGRVQIDVLDKDGQPLASGRSGDMGASAMVNVRPPQEIPVLAVDERGDPIAGAAVRFRMAAGYSRNEGFTVSLPARRLWRALGETDERGRLTARIAASKNPFEDKRATTYVFVAEKAGRKLSYSGFWQGPFHDGRQVAAADCDELRFTLAAAAPRAGELRGSAAGGLAAQPALVRLGVRVEGKEGRGWLHEELMFPVVTDGDGGFELPNVNGKIDEVDLLLRGDAVRTRLTPEKLRRRVPQRAVSLHGIREYRDQPLSFDLSALCSLELQVLDATGGPANDVELLVVSEEHGRHGDCDGWTTRATTDSAGRVALLLQPGKWFVFGRNARDMIQLSVALDGDLQRELRLTPMPAMRGRVVDEDGAPVAGARMDCYSSSSTGARESGFRMVASSLNWSWLDAPVTDENGEFVCPFLAHPSTRYKARFRLGSRRSEGFRVEADEAPVTITLPKAK